jgi:uncharacterized protein DUF4259
MGTWGSGPLDSDTAEDYLDALENRSAAQRLTAIEETFASAIERGGTSGLLPEEVIAAAAVVAANVRAGRSLEWNEEYPSITEWLAKPIPPGLPSAALQALEATQPADDWYWRSWADAADREEAQGFDRPFEISAAS